MDLDVYNYIGKKVSVYINRIPDTCPWCHHGIDPILVNGFKEDILSEIIILFMCPKEGCRRFFIGWYEYRHHRNFDKYVFIKTFLGQQKFKNFPEVISDISANFITIYNQSMEAEYHGLDQISGPGYRKAIEFLIKDYLIFKTPGLKEKVESSFLKTCIDLLPDSNLKATALRGTWIGNDTVHYTKKWIDKDISDLKTAIDLIIHWITYEHATEQMIKEMP